MIDEKYHILWKLFTRLPSKRYILLLAHNTFQSIITSHLRLCDDWKIFISDINIIISNFIIKAAKHLLDMKMNDLSQFILFNFSTFEFLGSVAIFRISFQNYWKKQIDMTPSQLYFWLMKRVYFPYAINLIFLLIWKNIYLSFANITIILIRLCHLM